MESAPEVFNHNTETVPRLYRTVRGRKSDYRWTLELLRRAKQLDPNVKTKSGLMLGLGETREELFDVLADLLDAGCDMLTLGQYLQPTPGTSACGPIFAPGRVCRIRLGGKIDGIQASGQRPICPEQLPRRGNGQ